MEIIECKDLRKLITELYTEDEEFVKNYHDGRGNNLTDCINDTLGVLVLTKTKVYSIIKDQDLIGYFGEATPNSLCGFFIKKDKRSKENKEQFVKLMREHFKTPFLVNVDKKHIPVIKFLKKAGFNITEELDKSVILRS